MSFTLENLRLIALDLKQSWYFRIWAVLFFILFWTGFAGLVTYGERATKATGENDVVVWLQNATELKYPGFYLSFQDDPLENTFTAARCVVQPGGLAINSRSCPSPLTNDMSKCRMFETSQTAKNRYNAKLTDQMIQCHVNSTKADAKSYVGFNFVVDSEYHPSDAELYIAPRPGAWILTHPIINDDMILNTKAATLWTRYQQYQDSRSTPGQYEIHVSIDDFRVVNYRSQTYYTQWMSTADVGGFAFFLVLIHLVCMVIVGALLSNESMFLTGKIDGY